MLAYPNASQPGLQTLGPQWNAARSTHHRVAWLARESSNPAESRSNAGRCRPAPLVARTRERRCRPRDRQADQGLRRNHRHHATPALAEAVLWREAQTLDHWGNPGCGTPAWASAATGASATASRTPSSRASGAAGHRLSNACSQGRFHFYSRLRISRQGFKRKTIGETTEQKAQAAIFLIEPTMT